jgi:hypothetical protein
VSPAKPRTKSSPATPPPDPATITELAERFHAIFPTREMAHGRYVLNGQEDERGKKLGTAQTVRLPITPQLWEKHLRGEYHLGGCPIRLDSTCRFGAIDIDSYKGFDLDKLAADIQRMNLPLIVCRTKSGGAHCYCFAKADIPADIMRAKLMEMAEALGYAGVEIFPKQTRLAGPTDFGNWINFPYHDVVKTERYGVVEKERLTAAKFLDLVAMMSVTEEDLRTLKLDDDPKFAEKLKGAPPCLKCLAARGGVPEGSRNNGLFNFGVYLRKRYGDEWEAHMDQFNQDFVTPPLGHREVQGIARSVGKNTYQYKCHEEPISKVCNRQICLTREFGIGGGENDPGVVYGPLEKINSEPPLWIWDVDGARIEMTTEQLKDQGRAHTAIINVLNKWPHVIKPRAWTELVRERLANVTVHEVPPEATLESQVMVILQEFCTGKTRARVQDELLQGKPWTDPESGNTFFSGLGFKHELERHKIFIEPRRMWATLRKNGVGHKFMTIRGKGINLWLIKSFTEQTEPFSVPRVADLKPVDNPTNENGELKHDSAAF